MIVENGVVQNIKRSLFFEIQTQLFSLQTS